MAPLDFSNVIAFLLPGFVAFYSLTYVSPRASELIAATLSKDAGAGVLLMIVLFSLAAGIVVSALRGLLLDAIQLRTGVNRPELDYSKLTDQHTFAAYNGAIAGSFRFAQFYGNMLVAMIFLIVGKTYYQGDLRNQWLVYIVFLLTIIVLFVAHRRELEKTYKRLEQILGKLEPVKEE